MLAGKLLTGVTGKDILTKGKKMRTKQLTLPISVVNVADGYIAASKIGGMLIRGRRTPSERLAIQSLMAGIGDGHDDDSVLALDMWISDDNLDDVMKELESGIKETE